MTAASSLELAQQLRPALTRLYVLYFRAAEQSDLSGAQLSIMSRLQEIGAARISKIAELEGIRMPTASNVLHALETRGLIERLRDEQDRRGVVVQLTALGAEELQRVGDERNQYLAELLDQIPEEYRKDLPRMVEIIAALGQVYSVTGEETT